MNSRQRRILRRLEQRAFGTHVDYYVSFEPSGMQLVKVIPDAADEAGADEESNFCMDCGAWLDADSEYVTASGDVFCRDCGRAEDEAQEERDAEDGFDFYPYAEDIVEGEEYGRYIGEGSENSASE